MIITQLFNEKKPIILNKVITERNVDTSLKVRNSQRQA